MAKTKVISSTRLEEVVINLSYDEAGNVFARIRAIGQTLVNGDLEDTFSVNLNYADLTSSMKNQCENFVKHMSRLLNKDGTDEDSETIDKIG